MFLTKLTDGYIGNKTIMERQVFARLSTLRPSLRPPLFLRRMDPKHSAYVSQWLRTLYGVCEMYQETPAAISEGHPPFDRDGTFNAEMAIDLALEKRALGDLDSADALDLLIDFFVTSQNYIFNGISSFNHEFALGGRNLISPAPPP